MEQPNLASKLIQLQTKQQEYFDDWCALQIRKKINTETNSIKMEINDMMSGECRALRASTTPKAECEECHTP
jgi:hypothetical protein